MANKPDSEFDFIIVGAGTSGCLLASTLSLTLSRPRILLVESGSHPTGPYLLPPAHRYHAMMLRPDLDHGYVSEPEPALGGRTIPYARGKGVGGCSVVNFGVYLRGSREDYARWGEIVGDVEGWGWEEVKRCFERIEAYNLDGFEGLAEPAGGKGEGGKLKVGVPPVLERGVREGIEALRKEGERVNLDPNSGDPVGVSVFPYSYSPEGRSTSGVAFLKDAPDNLTLWTDAVVTRLVFDGNKAVGVQTADGREARASKEVIMCAGAIDTPRLLLLSGIGPRAQLEGLGINVKQDLPVGERLQDHVLAFMGFEVDGQANERYSFETSSELNSEAAAQWEKDCSGAFALQHSCVWGGFLKHEELASWPEYQALDEATREYMAREAVPGYEFIGNALLWPPGSQLDQGSSYMTVITFLMNPQSEGSVRLRTADPQDRAEVRLNYLTHEFDRRSMREAVRATWTKVVDNPQLKKHIKRMLSGPATLSDEHVDDFLAASASTVWHANGTVMMGRRDNDKACVDSRFKVFGMEGLRVADVSVCPLTTNNHTQATAYLVGQRAADVLVEAWGLDNCADAGVDG